MTIKQVRVYSPGSIANLGPGFDVFGVALEGIGDIIVLEESPEPGVKIDVQGVGADKIPSDPEKNSSGAILNHVIEQYEPRHGFNVEIRKGIPPGTGMGSSGASAAATTVAVNEMLGLHLSDRELVKGRGQLREHPTRITWLLACWGDSSLWVRTGMSSGLMRPGSA